jgi:hypothetical protein
MTPVVNLPPVSTTPAAKLPPVSTTQVAKFAAGFTSVVDTGAGKFGISPRILVKIRNGPNGILWGWGETDS